MKRSVIAVAALMAVGTVQAEFRFGFVSDHADILYRTGETATVRVAVKAMDGAPAKTGAVEWRIDNFGDKVLRSGRHDLAKDGAEIVLSEKLTEPGFVRVNVREAGQGKWACWGVACDCEKIRPGAPCPDDFNSFWRAAVDDYAAKVKDPIRLAKLGSLCNAKRDMYRVEAKTVQGRTVYGFWSVPKAGADAKLPLLVQVPGAGPSEDFTAGDDKSFRLFMNVHYYLPDGPAAKHSPQREAFQKREDAEWNAKFPMKDPRYCKAGIAASREDYFYYDVLLAISRAVDWAVTQPGVDRTRVRYNGTSQGGGFGLWLCGLNRNFTRAVVFVPALTDLLGFRAGGRMSGWPRLVEGQLPENRAAAERNAPYFDGVNFARNIGCPIRFIVGGADTVCPPMAGISAYNVAPSKDKAIRIVPGQGHAVSGTYYHEYGKWLEESGDAAGGTLELECERFENLGGWKVDSQFRGQMGSTYLIAHGLGWPVADATTRFEVTTPGRYRVSVRTMNWTAPWSDKEPAGRFQVLVDGKALVSELGTGDATWRYRDAGAVDLAAGRHTLALHDLTGFDGRCDAIRFEPANTPTPKHSNVQTSKHPNAQTITSDLVVAGGGIAGICTAISAARLGLRVALVQDRPVLGGNNSSEVRVHLGAWQNMPPYPRLGDVVAEIGPKEGGNARDAANYEDDRKLKAVQAETNIVLYLNTQIVAAKTSDATRRIESVTGENVVTGERIVFAAPLFVDCTGDGAVGVLAGADYRMGREAKGETDEPWAPEKPDMLTLGASVQWNAGPADGAVEFPFRPWMIRFTDENGRAELRGDWDWEAGLGRDQIAEAEYIRDYGLLVAYSNWAFAKNFSKKREAFRDKELKWVAYVAGRRESRRLMGDFVLSEKHILARDYQPDGTCATTWTIDLHFPKTFEQSKFAGEPFRSNSENESIWPYPVPYRCYYSRNVPNLFMAGRDISVTHIALGTTRLMRTHGMMGEVVGMAASLCRKHGCDPRAIYTTHFDELKALMEKGVGDGRAHPAQMYNIQTSLDPRFRDKKRGNCQITDFTKKGSTDKVNAHSSGSF